MHQMISGWTGNTYLHENFVAQQGRYCVSTGQHKSFPIHNHFHNILRLFDVLPNFPFPQLKPCAIITYEHGIYDLPHNLPNDLRLRILGNKGLSEKCLNFVEC